MDRNYSLIIATIFLAIGFVVSTAFSDIWMYIAIGWEAATFLYTIIIQDCVRNFFYNIREWFVLKRKTKFAIKTQREMENENLHEHL